MTWNHRVVKKTYTLLEGTDNEFTEDQYGIHEAYCDENGKVFGITKEPVSPTGETVDELKQSLEWMKNALDAPILDYDNIPEDGAIDPLEAAENGDVTDWD